MKRAMVLLLVLVIGIFLVAGCGKKSDSGAAASSGESSSSGGSAAGGGSGGTGKMLELNVRDCFFAEYPDNKFAYGEFIQPQLVARDESATMTFMLEHASSSLESVYEYLDAFKNFKGYSSEDITVAGFKTRRVTYIGDFGDYCSSLFMDFDYKESGTGGYRGMTVAINSDKDFDSTWTPDIRAVLESATVKQ